MKTLKLYLESVIDNDDVYLKSIIDNDDVCLESLLDNEDTFYGANSDKKMVESWIEDNYKIDGKLSISDDLVADCTGSVIVKNRNIESLATDMFRWGNIRGDFTCSFTYGCKAVPYYCSSQYSG